MKHQHLCGVARQHDDALALRFAERRAQHTGRAIDRIIELGIGEADVGGEVVNRDLVRCCPGEMGNEIE